MRRAGLVLVLVVVSLAVAACTSGRGSPSPSRPSGSEQPGTISPSPPPEGTVSAEIVLASTTITAGSTISGNVIVYNTTGRALRVSGCISPFAVGLGNDEVKAEIALPACLQYFTIPIGQSSWPVHVYATYSGCSREGGNGVPPCENGEIPPLPPGEYHAILFQSQHIVPKPPPVDVRVVP